MSIVEGILSFCYNNNCTPDTIVFEGRYTFDNMDDIVENWHKEHRSFLEEGDHKFNCEGLWNLRSIVLGLGNNSEILVDAPRFDEDRALYRNVYEFITKRSLRLPDVSIISYKIEYGIKKVNLDSIFKEFKFPTMVYNGMRKVPSNFDTIPEWMIENDKNEADVIYTRFKNMNIRIREHSITFKYNIGEDLDSILDEITTIIDTKGLDMTTSRFISISELDLNKPWKKHIMADIITNDREVSQIASVQESSKVLHEKKYLTSICVFSKFTIINESNKIMVRISSPKSYHDIEIILSIVLILFEIYEEVYDTIDKIYSRLYNEREDKIDIRENTLKNLRKIEPELFIHNYTRECPILPVVTDDIGSIDNPSILYHGKYYTAPEGYYVGLKVNRLSNKDKYQYLVTCYKTNHMKKENSITYKYVYGNDNIGIRKRKISYIRKINSKEYNVVQRNSFLECIESALGKYNGKISKYLHIVCKQDLWYMEDDQIKKNIVEGNIDSSYYRYYEELYSCNIITIKLSKGEYEISIPHHIGKYIWDYQPSNKCILIVEVLPPFHIRGKKIYELIFDDTCIFPSDEKNICNRFLKMKRNMTVKGIWYKMDDIVEQFIDSRGKCISVRDINMNEERCNIRPLCLKVYTPSKSILSDHMLYINKIRRKNGIDELIWDESNYKYNFFPNLESAVFWKNVNMSR